MSQQLCCCMHGYQLQGPQDNHMQHLVGHSTRQKAPGLRAQTDVCRGMYGRMERPMCSKRGLPGGVRDVRPGSASARCRACKCACCTRDEGSMPWMIKPQVASMRRRLTFIGGREDRPRKTTWVHPWTPSQCWISTEPKDAQIRKYRLDGALMHALSAKHRRRPQ
jgi:hypothetical protein